MGLGSILWGLQGRGPAPLRPAGTLCRGHCNTVAGRLGYKKVEEKNSWRCPPHLTVRGALSCRASQTWLSWSPLLTHRRTRLGCWLGGVSNPGLLSEFTYYCTLSWFLAGLPHACGPCRRAASGGSERVGPAGLLLPRTTARASSHIHASARTRTLPLSLA